MKTAVFILALATAVIGQERYVRPVDEAAKDPSFIAFRAKLVAAAERRDSAYILSILDPKIKNGFDTIDTKAEFKRAWRPERKDSRFWTQFLPVIMNGGYFHKEILPRIIFTAPYVFKGFPEDLSAWDYHSVFGRNVRLRRKPDLSSELVATLSYNVVLIERETLPEGGESEYPAWWLVRTLGGLRGYVRQEYVRSPIDFRAGFEKKRGVWKMIFFLAGD